MKKQQTFLKQKRSKKRPATPAFFSKVTIYNNQKDLILSKAHIKSLVKAVLKQQKVDYREVIIHFVEEKEIIDLHKQFFNDPTTTDCISFPIDGPCKEKLSILGEIFVCPKTAIAYAKKNKVDPFDETSLYIVHGLLHLIGYDDILKKDILVMRKKEKECMNLIYQKCLGISTKHTNILKNKQL